MDYLQEYLLHGQQYNHNQRNTDSIRTFNYSIPLTGGCGSVNATGTITVTANNTAGAPSSTPTLCINTAISPAITIATTGATGISNDGVSGANGLPAGVSAHGQPIQSPSAEHRLHQEHSITAFR